MQFKLSEHVYSIQFNKTLQIINNLSNIWVNSGLLAKAFKSKVPYMINIALNRNVCVCVRSKQQKSISGAALHCVQNQPWIHFKLQKKFNQWEYCILPLYFMHFSHIRYHHYRVYSFEYYLLTFSIKKKMQWHVCHHKSS